MNGWVKLHRQILENPKIMKDGDYLAVWIWLLLNAEYDKSSVLFGGKRIELKSGQLVTTLTEMSDKLGINKTKLKRILDCYASETQIETLTSSRNTLITVLNWDFYQSSETPSETQVKRKRNANETQMEHLPIIKEKKKGRNTQNYFEDDEVNQTFIDYLEMRKVAKIPTTEKAITLNINNVKKFCTANDGNLDVELAVYTIEQSIKYGWRGIFEPKDEHRQVIKPKVQKVNEKEQEEQYMDLWSDDEKENDKEV